MPLTVTLNGRLATPIALVLGGGLGTLTAMEVLVIGGHGKVGLRLLGCSRATATAAAA